VTIPSVKLPEGFEPRTSQMIVEGVCGDCRKN
jgi:hypothetical protein